MRVALIYIHYHVYIWYTYVYMVYSREPAVQHRKLSSVLRDDLDGGGRGRGAG